MPDCRKQVFAIMRFLSLGFVFNAGEESAAGLKV